MRRGIRDPDQHGGVGQHRRGHDALWHDLHEDEKWALAEKHFEESVAMNEGHGNLLGLAECYREMALLYKNWGQSRKTSNVSAVLHRLQSSRRSATSRTSTRRWRSSRTSRSRSRGHGRRSGIKGHVYLRSLPACRPLRYGDRQAIAPRDEVIKGIMIAAYLHDLGKVRVKKTILQKTRKLSVRNTSYPEAPDMGGRAPRRDRIPVGGEALIRYHQEKWDGSGYPRV